MAYSICFIFFISIFPLYALAQVIGTVAVGSILTANETSRPWLSPSGDFAFGFKQLQDEDQFLLSIWYEKIPDKTVVWHINSDGINPVVPRRSTIELNPQTGLLLRDPQGQSLWRPNVNQTVLQGFLNDTGNFILKGSDGSWLWESFVFPADTILPSQEFASGSIVDSRKSETNFSLGRFYLQFQDDGNLVLSSRTSQTVQNADVVYYASGTSDYTNQSNSGYRFVFDNQGSIYIMKRNNETVQLSQVSALTASENYLRAKLDFDGVFALYSYPKNFSGDPGWSILWSQPDNICTALMGDMGSGVCGYNSICHVESGRPVCQCPTIYTLVDPNDKYGSCKPNSALTCDAADKNSTTTAAAAAANLYAFLEIPDVDWPKNDFELIPHATAENCRQVCLEDCVCAVSIFRSNTCWKKRLPLANGRVDTTLGSKVFMKYRVSDARPPTPKDRETLILVGSVLLGSSLFVNLALTGPSCLGFYLIYRKMKRMVKLQPGATVMEKPALF